ncbi:regulator [Gordonia sp. PKS22-38]|uniref:Regulator n=1 Tax=Gordonia prachuapensis TaxID=3115651 RepID=A0ABU7MVP3_9ACTN|nr:regulator [Gordonia sp. PKS22-38]
MTSQIDRELRVPLYPLPSPTTVAIVAERDISDAALVALVESLGYHAVVVDLDAHPEPLPPAIAIVRSADKLARFRALRGMRNCLIAAIGVDLRDAPGVAIADSPLAARQLERLLEQAARRRPELRSRVNVTERELEILTTYALGATLRETAQTHYVAESTVRAHYRRVSQRYCDAGRQVGNKAQLLLQFMADGWVLPEQLAV